MNTIVYKKYAIITPHNRKERRMRLSKNHTQTSPIWLRYFKKHTGISSLTYSDVVEECLCWGWIDSTINSYDQESYVQLISPRKPKSTWSKVNKAKVEKLIEQGLMMPSGKACIDIAKQNGSWNSIDDSENEIVPQELQNYFSQDPQTQDFFEKLSRTNRKSRLHRIYSAKTSSTRSKRVEQTLTFLKQGVKNYFFKK